MLTNIALVGLGGMVGSISRFLLGSWVIKSFPASKFPLGTFVVNVLGCALAGALVGLFERYNAGRPELRLLLITGFLGGLTTFSAFGIETVALLQRHEMATAMFNVAGSIAVGFAALWITFKLLA